MAERKVLNKYYSPGFDPAKIPRIRKPKNEQSKVRMMLPMMCRCTSCGNYLYPGTKFNSRKEAVSGDKYLDRIQVFRFYFRCTRCSSEITYKTDPQNNHYAFESGATPCFEAVDEEKKRKRGPEERIKNLEEMDVIAALDELKSLKSRHASVMVDAMIDALPRCCAREEDKDHLEEEGEILIKSIDFHGSHRRIKDDYDELDDDIGKLDIVVAKRPKGTGRLFDQDAPAQSFGCAQAGQGYRVLCATMVVSKLQCRRLLAAKDLKERIRANFVFDFMYWYMYYN